MRILYSLSGEGFGHSSRGRVLIPYLESKGHSVLVVTYGQAYSVMKDDFNVMKVSGVHLGFREGRVSKSKTVGNVWKVISENVGNWRAIKKRIDAFRPEVCISDMEPLVPIIRYWYDLPLISFDNQHRLTHLKLQVPDKYKKDYYLARESVRRIVSRADAFVILSFVKQKSLGKNVRVVDPILREEVLKRKARKGKHVLVYQTKKDRGLLKKLQAIEGEKYVVFLNLKLKLFVKIRGERVLGIVSFVLLTFYKKGMIIVERFGGLVQWFVVRIKI